MLSTHWPYPAQKISSPKKLDTATIVGFIASSFQKTQRESLFLQMPGWTSCVDGRILHLLGSLPVTWGHSTGVYRSPPCPSVSAQGYLSRPFLLFSIQTPPYLFWTPQFPSCSFRPNFNFFDCSSHSETWVEWIVWLGLSFISTNTVSTSHLAQA